MCVKYISRTAAHVGRAYRIHVYAFRCSINNNLNLTVWETTTACADDKKKKINKKETAEREKHAKFVVPAGARYAINNYNQLKSWFIFLAGNVAAAARGCEKEYRKKDAREGRVGGYIVPPSIRPAHKPTHPPNPPPLIHPSRIYIRVILALLARLLRTRSTSVIGH